MAFAGTQDQVFSSFDEGENDNANNLSQLTPDKKKEKSGKKGLKAKRAENRRKSALPDLSGVGSDRGFEVFSADGKGDEREINTSANGAGARNKR